MEASLQELVKDINDNEYCTMHVYVYNEDEVEVKSVKYQNLDVWKDNQERIFLGTIDEGYVISEQNTILKEVNDDSSVINYEIKENDMLLLSLSVYNE